MKITVKKCVLESAQLIRAKNDIRYYLNGIYFTKSGDVVSTDGHRLFVSKMEEKIKSSVIVNVGKSPSKNYDHAEIDTVKGLVRFYKDGINVGVALCSVVDGRYPDYERIIPKELISVDKIGFNASYLSDVGKVVKLFNPKFESVLFSFSGVNSASIANFSSAEGISGKIIVMPMRI